MRFEKNLKRLEEIVDKMEAGEISLDDSLKLFEEGVKLSQSCNNDLDKAETKVQSLLKVDNEGNVSTEDFEVSE